MQANVGEIGGEHVGRFRAAHVVDAQGDAVPTQRLVGFFAVPRAVTKLCDVAIIRRQELQEAAQTLVVAFEIRRKLRQNHRDLRLERNDRRKIVVDETLGLAEIAAMRDEAAQLDGKAEIVGDCCQPTRDRIGARKPIRRRVELDRREMLRVMREPITVG